MIFIHLKNCQYYIVIEILVSQAMLIIQHLKSMSQLLACHTFIYLCFVHSIPLQVETGFYGPYLLNSCPESVLGWNLDVLQELIIPFMSTVSSRILTVGEVDGVLRCTTFDITQQNVHGWHGQYLEVCNLRSKRVSLHR